MASVTLSIVGGVVGSAFGGPIGGMIGSTLGSMVGGVIDSYLFREDEHQDTARLGDTMIQVATYGQPIPIPYGTVRLAGNIIWADDIREHSDEDDVGKGGGSTVTTYTYTAAFAVALCEGPITHVQKIWADQKLIYDANAATPSKYGDVFTFYLGTETQLPDPTMESVEGAGQIPAHRGLAYMLLGPSHNFPLADFGNRLPNITAELCRQPESA